MTRTSGGLSGSGGTGRGLNKEASCANDGNPTVTDGDERGWLHVVEDLPEVLWVGPEEEVGAVQHDEAVEEGEGGVVQGGKVEQVMAVPGGQTWSLWS